MIYIISLSIFSGIILFLVGLLLLLQNALTKKGDRFITLNGDTEKRIEVTGTPTVLTALLSNNIFLPSACGGGGSGDRAARIWPRTPWPRRSSRPPNSGTDARCRRIRPAGWPPPPSGG